MYEALTSEWLLLPHTEKNNDKNVEPIQTTKNSPNVNLSFPQLLERGWHPEMPRA